MYPFYWYPVSFLLFSEKNNREPEAPGNAKLFFAGCLDRSALQGPSLQKGGVPAAPSGTATLLRLSPSHRFYPRPLLNGYGLQAPPASMA